MSFSGIPAAAAAAIATFPEESPSMSDGWSGFGDALGSRSSRSFTANSNPATEYWSSSWTQSVQSNRFSAEAGQSAFPISSSSYLPPAALGATGGDGGSILDQLSSRSFGSSFSSDLPWMSSFGNRAQTGGFCSGSGPSSSLPFGQSASYNLGCRWNEGAQQQPAEDYRGRQPSPLLAFGSSAPIAAANRTLADYSCLSSSSPEEATIFSSSLDSCLKAIWKDAEEELLVEARFRTLSLNSEVSTYSTTNASSFSSSSFFNSSSSSLVAPNTSPAGKAVEAVAAPPKNNEGDFESSATPPMATFAAKSVAEAVKASPKLAKEGEKEKMIVLKKSPMAGYKAFRGGEKGGGGQAEKKIQLVESLVNHLCTSKQRNQQRTRYDSESGRTLVGRDPLNPKSFASACVVLPPKQQQQGGNDSGRAAAAADGGGNGNGGGQKRPLPSTSANGCKVPMAAGGGGGGNRARNNNNSSLGNFAPARGGGGHRSRNGGGGGAGGNRGKRFQQQCHQQQRPPTKMECSFCRNISGPDGESDYKTHWLKDRQNVITCPKLRAYTCPLCHCPGGDMAHTKLYCPLKRQKLAEEFQRAKGEQGVPKKASNYGRLAGGGGF